MLLVDLIFGLKIGPYFGRLKIGFSNYGKCLSQVDTGNSSTFIEK